MNLKKITEKIFEEAGEVVDKIHAAPRGEKKNVAEDGVKKIWANFQSIEHPSEDGEKVFNLLVKISGNLRETAEA